MNKDAFVLMKYIYNKDDKLTFVVSSRLCHYYVI